MDPIIDQDPSKNQCLIRDIVVHAVEQANLTIRFLNQRSTVHMLMQCEDTLTDFLPIVQMIAFEHDDYQVQCTQMQKALDAVQVSGEPEQIDLPA